MSDSTPNNNPIADSIVNSLAHELAEIVTNPWTTDASNAVGFYGWYVDEPPLPS